MPLNLTGAFASRKPSRRVRFAPAARFGELAASSPPVSLRPQVSADTLDARLPLPPGVIASRGDQATRRSLRRGIATSR
jgi:hypothetical protein